MIRWLCGENFIFYRYKRGGAKTVIVPFVGKRSLYPGIHITIRKDAVPLPASHCIQSPGARRDIRTEKDYAYLIQRCKDGFVLREFWAERTYWKDSLPCESLTGMSFAVRFMTAVEKYALTIGACIASGKHAGFPVIPATIVTVAIRQAGSMARAFPAWNRRSCSALALCSGYAPIR